jgi:hypothetical protein
MAPATCMVGRSLSLPMITPTIGVEADIEEETQASPSSRSTKSKSGYILKQNTYTFVSAVNGGFKINEIE